MPVHGAGGCDGFFEEIPGYFFTCFAGLGTWVPCFDDLELSLENEKIKTISLRLDPEEWVLVSRVLEWIGWEGRPHGNDKTNGFKRKLIHLGRRPREAAHSILDHADQYERTTGVKLK